MNWQDDALNLIKKDEGCSLELYEDSRGFWTIGWGRCLQTKILTQAEADYLLGNDFKDACEDAIRYYPDFWNLTDGRKIVLINMAFNLGLKGLSEFVKLEAAMTQGNWSQASAEILNSKLAPNRRQRLASQMLSG